MQRRLLNKVIPLASLAALVFSASACGGTSAAGFDAAPIRRDSGFVPYDAGSRDLASQPDTANPATDAGNTRPDANHAPDTYVPTNDAAQDQDSAQPDQDAAVSTRDASVNLEAGPNDAAAPVGLGVSCTGDNDCVAPYTCAIPSGQTQGFCLAACANVDACGRSQVCEAIHESIPGTWCLDVVPRGGSCMEVSSRCETGTDCFVTDQDADGNPSAALCKQTCTLGQSGTCSNTESCMSSGYVDVEHDANDAPVMCDTDANVCTGDYSCMDLRTNDGRTVKACAMELGWCGVAGGPGDSCNEDQDLYCGEMTDPIAGNDQDAAFAVCAEQCWYLCSVPAAYTSDGQDHNYDCADDMSCVQGPADLFPDGVKVCDHGFDAGVVTTEDAGSDTDAAQAEDAGFNEDAGPACEPCAAVTFIGVCEQDVLSWCDSDGCLQSSDCTQRVVGNSALHCSEFSADWGFDCLAAEGGACNPDYPAQPTNPNAPTSPGCDPSVGACNPATFICGSVPDGGFPVTDAGSEDAGSTCQPCTLDNQEVPSSGSCAGDQLVWCGSDNCLHGFDCADTSRSCSEVTVNSGTDSYPWADCFGSSGAACVDADTYFGNLENTYTDPNWLCDPDTSCDTSSNTCL